jgi:antimicrobial peptide system SdpA family protein
MPRRLLLTCCLTYIPTIVLIIMVGLTYSPYSPVVLNKKIGSKIRLFAPQGWKFFTKSPREDIFLLYRMQSDSSFTMIDERNGDFTNFFGAIKRPRIRAVAAGTAYSQIPPSYWQDYRGTFSSAPSLDSLLCFTAFNMAKSPRLPDGIYIFQEIALVPWAWSNKELLKMPSKIAKVKIVCL